MLSVVQGLTFKVKVPSSSCQFVASDGANKIIVNNVIEDEDGVYYLSASSDETKDWIPTSYTYQIMTDDELVEQGKLKVRANLLYWTSADSYWATVVKAIEAKLAGKAESAAYSVSVDGKSISYMNTDELLKLLSFAKGKLAEEQAEEEGKEPWDRTNGGKIIYFR